MRGVDVRSHPEAAGADNLLRQAPPPSGGELRPLQDEIGAKPRSPSITCRRLLYSINYDHTLTPHVAARVGLMGLGGATDSGSAAVLAAPVMVSYLFGEGNSHFEVGLGMMMAAGAVDEVDPVEDESFSGAVGTATVGYRYQRPYGGFIFRTGLTPFFDHTGFAPSFGISFGYGF